MHIDNSPDTALFLWRCNSTGWYIGTFLQTN